MDNEKLVETLLYSGEGNALDFKLLQYKFEGASDEEKSELLKDILAFANSWRETTAHIVIGVRDGSKEVEGLDRDVDDAKIQQFVNSKTNKPLHFSYHSLTFKGKKIGLYTIPVQERPFYIKKNFGNLKADTVYVRRGSSTDEAKPDEIAKMGYQLTTALTQPNLKTKIVSLDKQATQYDSLKIEYTEYFIDKSNPLPDYVQRISRGIGLTLENPFSNKSYYRQMATYIREQLGCFGFSIEMENSGSLFADDIRVYLSAPSSPGFKLVSKDGFNNRPKKSEINTVNYRTTPPFGRQNLTFSSTRNTEVAEILMGKIQAGETKRSPAIYLICPPETLDSLNLKILSDQLKLPIDITIPVFITKKRVSLTKELIERISSMNEERQDSTGTDNEEN